ncbi:MAG: SGNH hydrolase domain-containing protein [Actinomycetota bacterium]
MRNSIVARVSAGLALLTLVGCSSQAVANYDARSAPQLMNSVARASTQTSLTRDELSQLRSASTDLALTGYPKRGTGASNCQTVGQCEYGDVKSKTTVILFGDSHAVMWLPALAPAARKLHLKLELIWLGACPTSMVRPFAPNIGDPSYCDGFRVHAHAQIIAAHPKLVLLAEKTSQIPTGVAIYPWYTGAQIKKGLIVTIRKFQQAGIRVGVIEDIANFAKPVPLCLSLHPRAIQKCSAPFNDAPKLVHREAERDAALATGAQLLQTHLWLCTSKTCPPVLGGIIAYADADHVSYTYAQTLSRVFGDEVRAAMAH